MRRRHIVSQVATAPSIVPSQRKPPRLAPSPIGNPERIIAAADRWMRTQLGSATHRHAVALLDQQMWCWGQDVRHAGKNGLVDFGFERFPPPHGIQAGSCYRWCDSCGRRVALWGFGMFYGCACRGGIFLRRYRFAQTLTLSEQWPDPCWRVGEFPTIALPDSQEDWQRATSLLIDALDWIANYEGWATSTMGTSHRERCLSTWKNPCCGADEITTHWHQLAGVCRNLIVTA